MNSLKSKILKLQELLEDEYDDADPSLLVDRIQKILSVFGYEIEDIEILRIITTQE